MKTTLITASSFKINLWSGGTSTELFIHPPQSSYAERNFGFRISTATVQAETSTFTQLPGISRKLMVLAGITTLVHQNNHTARLQKFDVDTFEGDWQTTSFGKCTDFNVMTTGDWVSTLQAICMNAQETVAYNPSKKAQWVFLYAYAGCASAAGQRIEKGDLLAIESPEPAFKLHAQKSSVLIVSEIMQR